jgi:hypothetical protein
VGILLQERAVDQKEREGRGLHLGEGKEGNVDILQREREGRIDFLQSMGVTEETERGVRRRSRRVKEERERRGRCLRRFQ